MDKKERLINETFTTMEKLAGLYRMTFEEFRDDFKDIIERHDTHSLEEIVKDLENGFGVKDGKKFVMKFLAGLIIVSENNDRSDDAKRFLLGEHLLYEMMDEE